MAKIDRRLELLSALLADKHPEKTLMASPLDKRLFMGDSLEAYQFITDYLKKNGAVPTPSIVDEETGVSLPEVEGHYGYYLEKVEHVYKHTTLMQHLDDVEDLMNEDNAEQAIELLTGLMIDLRMFQNRSNMFNFTSQGGEIIKSDYMTKLKSGADILGISTGWDYLDDMIGGLIAGDFFGIVGRPASGKTYLALSIAEHVWAKQKKVPLVVSMEMAPLAIMQRAAAMHFKKPITQLKHAMLSTGAAGDLWTGLTSMDGSMPDYWILDGNLAATVDDLIIAVQQINPDVVIVDGAYLLGSDDHRKPKWQTIGDNAEAMKMKIATTLGIPVIASYQLNRNYMKDLKAGMAPGVEHIAGADAIGQIASVIVGLMQEEGIETKVKRRVKVLKGRSGEEGEFDINWIFDKWPFMDFSEIKPIADDGVSGDTIDWHHGDLQFLG